MVRHKYICAYIPSMLFLSSFHFVKQNESNLIVVAYSITIIGACCDEENRVLDPYSFQSMEMCISHFNILKIKCVYAKQIITIFFEHQIIVLIPGTNRPGYNFHAAFSKISGNTKARSDSVTTGFQWLKNLM